MSFSWHTCLNYHDFLSTLFQQLRRGEIGNGFIANTLVVYICIDGSSNISQSFYFKSAYCTLFFFLVFIRSIRSVESKWRRRGASKRESDVQEQPFHTYYFTTFVLLFFFCVMLCCTVFAFLYSCTFAFLLSTAISFVSAILCWHIRSFDAFLNPFVCIIYGIK